MDVPNEVPSDATQSTTKCQTPGCNFYGTRENNQMCSVCAKNCVRSGGDDNTMSVVGNEQRGATISITANQIARSSTSPNPASTSTSPSAAKRKMVLEHGMEKRTCAQPGVSFCNSNNKPEASHTSDDQLTRTPRPETVAPTPSEAASETSIKEQTPVSVTSAGLSNDVEDESKPDPPKSTKRRCGVCNKKCVISQPDCEGCSTVFCNQHRLPHEHNCSFNYRDADRQRIREQNPAVVGAKITKI